MALDAQIELPGMPEKPPPEPFTLDGTVETRVDITVDLAYLIRNYPKEYRGCDMTRLHEEWERPMVFLHEYLQDRADAYYGGDGVDERFDEFDFHESLRWTEGQYEDLCRVCPEADLGRDRP